MKNMIADVLENWDLDSPEICEQYNVNSPRLIFKIKTQTQNYLIKGLPSDISKETVKSNIQAHLFLGNENGLAPKLYPSKTGEYFVRHNDFRFYLMEFIDGRQMKETPEDEYKIGQISRKLHALKNYTLVSPYSQKKERYYSWFRDLSFAKEFDAILDSIPDFENLDQCFTHTDIGPHNTMLRSDGQAVFIDLDGSGVGSRYLDLGWAFIMQFVDFNHDTEEMNYRFDLAQSFLQGYYGEDEITREEYDLIFFGAMQMHISYMKTYGPDAVESLWKILLFGIAQKETLWKMIQNK